MGLSDLVPMMQDMLQHDPALALIRRVSDVWAHDRTSRRQRTCRHFALHSGCKTSSAPTCLPQARPAVPKAPLCPQHAVVCKRSARPPRICVPSPPSPSQLAPLPTIHPAMQKHQQ